MNILFFLKPKADLAYIYDYHTVRQAMEIMEHYKYSCVPILNRDGKYLGTITEGDLLWGLKKNGITNMRQIESTAVMKIQRRFDYKPVSIESDMEDLVKRSMEQNFVPVEDDDHNFIGIVTRRDIIGYLNDQVKGRQK
ncbi:MULTISPECIES: CBS domain-containing protein [Sellimonas]|uniref:CBS domain-containing protein n=1 Tax=Sellimonas caecigallum TaxID=2592333 RepID=A0ABS7L894_9FIRM|nr:MULTISPECIES: CBS domain-containing protein [Sellimonas]MBY0759089.1 CBS domain-containing protein [Sellimonas caecigallum]OUP02227.1 hypothetical protein B5F37_05085 [Drancourtella sp. An210]OUP65876.1 hypothetical protein B5F13_05355 [Drancourtella sp. An177]